MTRPPVQGTQGYSAEAPELLKLYESIGFEDAHRGVLDLIPPAPIDVLDIGAGTGRDAARRRCRWWRRWCGRAAL